MPRPTPAQICWGTLAVVSTTVVLLAVSGADSLLGITVLVVFALALGTVATTLSITGRTRHGGRHPGSRIVGVGGAAQPARPADRVRQPAPGAEFAQPSSGRG